MTFITARDGGREPQHEMILWRTIALCLFLVSSASAAAPGGTNTQSFPVPLAAYSDESLTVWGKLANRASAEPLNVIATALFFAAILHTFLAPRIMHLAHRWRDEHSRMLEERRRAGLRTTGVEQIEEVSFKAEVAHFFGEVEAVFGLWVLPLLVVVMGFKGWETAVHYVSNVVQYTEPLFVVIIMVMAASRPVLVAAEKLMTFFARLGGGGPAAFWFSILTIGPLIGSLITEPAAMTISALLLSRRFYEAQPRPTFAYATLGLLFVNVSIGGTLTHFAAPPVLMVAGRWGWGMEHMAMNFGWKASLGILAGNVLYWAWFRKEFRALKPISSGTSSAEPVPVWITVVHLVFLSWTVLTAHHPALFIGGFLFFLAFISATEHHQGPVVLRPALLVGFFLAGLVIHGGLQSWWISPVIEGLSATPLFFGSIVLTAFNDNAAITFLATLVPDLDDAMKYAVVAGAVTGGGLTVIANAPNPAGQAILVKHFPDGVLPLKLLLAALAPTAIAALIFLLFR